LALYYEEEKMFVRLDKKSAECIGVLSQEIGLSKGDVIRLAIADAGAFFLGQPHRYIIFERKEWNATLNRIAGDVKRRAKRKEQRDRDLVEAAKN